MKNPKLAFRTSCAATALAFAAPALAQDPVTVPEETGEERTLNQVVVTGSFIRRQSQADLASPLDTVSSVDIGNIGAQNIADLTQTLTINTGAQNNPDAFTQGGTTGTSNINLRGLGVASTLILLNGKRQTLSSAPTNDGINFVDTSSLVPLIAVERVEILKDGASSLYGSDAVAGVVNFITRKEYEGALFSAEYTNHLSQGEYDEFNIQGLVGGAIGDLNLMGAFSYLDRSALTTEERRLSTGPIFGPGGETLFLGDDTSNLGNPGSFFGVPGFPATAPVIDPGCAAAGGVPNIISATPAGVPDVGLCGFDFGEFFNLVPDEQRITLFTSANYDITDNIRIEAEFGYADNEAVRGNSPTFPVLQSANAIVPSFNPNNIFGEDIIFFGRAIGNGGSVSPASFDSETWRFATTVEGDFSLDFFSNARWNLNFTRAQNDFVGMTEDTVTDRFACSLRGFNAVPAFNTATGLDCTASNPFLTANGRTIPADGTFFNPFSSSLIGGAPNDPALLDYLIEFGVSDRESELTVVEGFVSGDLFELPAGPIGLAVGAQYRRQDISASFDEITENDGFAFLIGEQPFDGSQDVYAFFGELAVPLTEWADLQVALRYEDYGEDGGDTLDPKVALLLRPTDWLSLRGSYSTSFRAPSTFQLVGQSTTLQQVTDPNPATAGNAFVAVRALGNPDLVPEDSQAFNVGGTVSPIDGLELNVDYFNFEFDDAIIQTSPQAIVDADPLGPNVIRSPAGTIIQVNNGFANAATVETSGIDFSIRYTADTPIGSFTPTFIGTYIIDYTLEDPLAGEVSGEGNRNFTNFGSPTPELRFNAGVEYTNGAHSFNIFGRYIDSYTDDQNGGVTIEDDFRVDLQYGVAVNEYLNRDKIAQFTVGVRNVFGARPPSVNTNGGFDSRVHDPRGALLTVGLDVEF
ncbi:MAG: TonB-dependent receptor [Pseudomonadota bacterium]